VEWVQWFERHKEKRQISSEVFEETSFETSFVCRLYRCTAVPSFSFSVLNGANRWIPQLDPDLRPMINQVEFHPRLVQTEMLDT